ncbi:MAG TPA: hypothetical protein VFR37_04450 [Longimicrobium sp.]|nr:hypothetical protein [Longimicrobium sp.]
MRRATRWAGCALGVLVMAGCAANPRAQGATEEAFVRVVVENQRERPDFLRVFLVPASGAEIALGVTSTLGTDTLVARGHLPSGRYSLRAEGSTGGITRSTTVFLRGGDTLHWNLRDHTVRQSR